MTKLQALQEILQRCGLRPPSALQTGSPSDMGLAEQFFDQESLDVQAIGWEYNTRFNIELSPSLYTFDNATYDDSVRSLTQAGAFADATVGQTLNLEATGIVVAGEYIVESLLSDNAVTLTTSATEGAGNQSGVSGAALDNKIVAPEYAISFDTDAADEWREFTQQGRRLYDNTNNTDLFTNSIKTTYVEQLEIGCVPYQVRKYIMMRTALRLAQFRNLHVEGIRRDMLIAERRAFEYNTKAMRLNIHGTRDARAMRANRTSSAFFRNGN